ncbi:MAG: MotA/TolQ/ExbB proton channel family protein [Luteolibacter sp.]
MTLQNTIIETFHKGGPIMWPILLASIVGAIVVAERAIWWVLFRARSDRKLQGLTYQKIAGGKIQDALRGIRTSKDPVLQVIRDGLDYHETSLETSLQIAAANQIHRASRNLNVLDTIITLGPLLGLLGTVTGIMGAFNFVGNEEVAAVKVSGGIAEALIATAAGLGIAIFNLLPFNYFHSRITKLAHELQTVNGKVEVLLLASENHSHTQVSRHENAARDAA